MDGKKLDEWLASSPESVRVLAKEWPLNTSIADVAGVVKYVVGYTEEGHLMLADKQVPDFVYEVDGCIYILASCCLRANAVPIAKSLN